MSFWSEASGLVKGVIIIGAIAIGYLLVAKVAGLAPFGSAAGAEATQSRGLQQN